MMGYKPSLVARRPTELLTAFVAAVLVLIGAFGVDLTEGQSLAILGVVGLLPAVTTWLVDKYRIARGL